MVVIVPVLNLFSIKNDMQNTLEFVTEWEIRETLLQPAVFTLESSDFEAEFTRAF